MVKDLEATFVTRNKGIQLINSMNSVNMVIMNGVDNGGDYTYEVDNRKSINDYIILSDNILLPLVATNDTDDVQNEHKSNNIMKQTYSI